MLDELRERTSDAADRVLSALPDNFPEKIANSIWDGIKRRLRILQNDEQPDAAEAMDMQERPQ
jgi:hypothetical protein